MQPQFTRTHNLRKSNFDQTTLAGEHRFLISKVLLSLSKFTRVNEGATMKISSSITGSDNKFDTSKLRIQASGGEKVEREDSQSSKRVY